MYNKLLHTDNLLAVLKISGEQGVIHQEGFEVFLVLNDGEQVKFAYSEFSYLEELLGSIDVSLSKTNAQLTKLDVWDIGCLCDKGEYLIGAGSVSVNIVVVFK